MSKESKKVRVEVFVTRSCRFRAKIGEIGEPRYEVTINGKNWKEGLGREHRIRILEKAFRILDNLTEEVKKI